MVGHPLLWEDKPKGRRKVGRYERRVNDAIGKLRRSGDITPVHELAVAGILAAASAADSAEAGREKSWEYAVAANVRELGKLYGMLVGAISPAESADSAVAEALRDLARPTVEA